MPRISNDVKTMTYLATGGIVAIVSVLTVGGYKIVNNSIKNENIRNNIKLKSYNLSEDEFNRLNGRIKNGNITYYDAFDSLNQDLALKKKFEQGKQIIRDSINKALESVKKIKVHK